MVLISYFSIIKPLVFWVSKHGWFSLSCARRLGNTVRKRTVGAIVNSHATNKLWLACRWSFDDGRERRERKDYWFFLFWFENQALHILACNARKMGNILGSELQMPLQKCVKKNSTSHLCTSSGKGRDEMANDPRGKRRFPLLNI